METVRLLLVTLLLATGAARAAEPSPMPYRALSQGEVPSLVFGAVRRWAADLGQVKEVQDHYRDKDSWTPGFAAGAGLAGVVFGWRGSVNVAGWKVRLAQPGLAYGTARLLSVGLGRTDEGWSADASLGMRENSLLNDSFWFGYKLRY